MPGTYIYSMYLYFFIFLRELELKTLYESLSGCGQEYKKIGTHNAIVVTDTRKHTPAQHFSKLSGKTCMFI